jgi:RNA recognition motif-containing protein
VSNSGQTFVGLIEINTVTQEGYSMSNQIHVSGLPHSCTDDILRQAFIPFGKVVLAKVLKDGSGHSLGLGVVQMVRSEDVARVIDEHKRFEVLGSCVDLWEPAEPEAPDLREISTVQTKQEKRQVKNQKTLKPLMAHKPRPTRNQSHSSRGIDH